MGTDSERNQMARDRGYPSYYYAHDAVRQEIDALLEREIDKHEQ